MSALILPTTGSGNQVNSINPGLVVPSLLTTGGTGAGLWFDGATSTFRMFFGMAVGSDTLARIYGGALATDILNIDLATGKFAFPKNTGVTYTVTASGTAYTMTAIDALLDFGTTDPSITLATAGTYLLFGRANLKYNGATYAANQTATTHLRRTNNTAADVTNATTTATLRIITTITDTVGMETIPPTIYTTANTNDIIQVFGSVSATPSAGSVQAVEASITALLLV